MDKFDTRRVTVYLLISFGFSWSIALVIYLTGGISGSPQIVPEAPITWVLPLLTLYMLGPAVGNVGTRLLTREGRHDLLLRPKFKQGWKYWLIAWLLTPLMVFAGGILYFLIFPADLSLDVLNGKGIPGMPDTAVPGGALFMLNIGTAMLIAPLVNALPVLGEEFGWRGYLQPKLLPLGERKMYLLVGVIWGVWHWPVIWMGFNYPGHPLLGSLVMVWFTFIIGTFFGWAALRAGSVWPAVIGHGALNGTANIWLFFLTGETNPLIGPAVPGILGGAFFTIAMILIIWKAKNGEGIELAS